MGITDAKVTFVEIESPMDGSPRRMMQADYVQVLTDESIEGDYMTASQFSNL